MCHQQATPTRRGRTWPSSALRSKTAKSSPSRRTGPQPRHPPPTHVPSFPRRNMYRAMCTCTHNATSLPRKGAALRAAATVCERWRASYDFLAGLLVRTLGGPAVTAFSWRSAAARRSFSSSAFFLAASMLFRTLSKKPGARPGPSSCEASPDMSAYDAPRTVPPAATQPRRTLLGHGAGRKLAHLGDADGLLEARNAQDQ